MTDTIITVRGDHEIRRPPERAVVSLAARADGPDRAAVVSRIAATSERILADLDERKSSGTIAEYSSQRVSVWAERPWNDEGKQLAPVHHANLDVTATFVDFDEMSLWVTEVASLDGVHIGGVSWELTPESARATERDAARHAVTVAVERATAYARAVGMSTVTPREIADVGLLGGAERAFGKSGGRAVMMAASYAESAPSLQLQPSDIVVTSAVEARFDAH